jgi:hypothetical protein
MRKVMLYALYSLSMVFQSSIVKATPPQYSYQLSICSIFRDEARFLKEWIEFHLLVGVEHFYLFNNLSQDDYLSVLQPYMDNGIIELYDWPYESFIPYEFDTHQINAYRHCLEKARGSVKWLAFIDIDEYLVPMKERTLLPVLERFSENGGLTINWLLFGTSKIKKISADQLMIESLLMKGTYRESQNTRVKSIVQPERVRWIDNAHYVHYYPPYYAVDETGEEVEACMSNSKMSMEEIRINHYWTRDEEFFFHHKLNRRMKNLGQSLKDAINCAEHLNQEVDTAILRFVTTLRDKVFPKED